jgi:excisionase family DNA binding protein
MLNRKQVAKKLGVSERTINRWTIARVIPYYRVNGIVRYDEKMIDGWLEKKRVRVKSIV